LLGSNASVSALRGQWHECQGIPVRVTYHPSYLLRTSDLGERRRLWEEMLHVMEIAGLPINDKQRGYFLPKS
jgi:DNA polymerase